ncbi:MAG: YceI family protein [Saprospiraceae bacterium]|nr:YceI family protein [Candidatus Vicinibacter affinis]
MKSDDFSSSRFPVAKLDITKVGRSSAANTYLVDANLNINGISQPIVLSGGERNNGYSKIMVDRPN